MIPFNIQFKAGVPIYEQIVYAIKKAIISGQLSMGDRLPSIRTLSQELRVNPNTVQKAITTLINDGLVEAQPGIGCLVAKAKESTGEERDKLLYIEVEHLIVEAKKIGLTEKDIISAIQKRWKNLSGGGK